jgi:hypothetical protein
MLNKYLLAEQSKELFMAKLQSYTGVRASRWSGTLLKLRNGFGEAEAGGSSISG